MASHIPHLCLCKIINFLINDNHHQKSASLLYPCLLVNRHWCQTVIPYIWKSALNIELNSARNKKSLFNTLKKLNKKSSSPSFPYLSYIKSLNISLLIRLSIDTLNNKQDADESIRKINDKIELANLIFQKIVENNETRLSHLNIEFNTSVSQLLCSKENLTKKILNRWNPYSLKGAAITCSNLISLNLNDKYSSWILPIAARISRNICEINIKISSNDFKFSQNAYPGISKIFSHLEPFSKLSVLTLSQSDPPYYVLGNINGDLLLKELGSNLPAREYIKFAIDLNFEFTSESLRSFFQITKAKFSTLSFSASEVISDEHLEVFIEFTDSHQINEIDLSTAKYLTTEALENAKKYIPAVNGIPMEESDESDDESPFDAEGRLWRKQSLLRYGYWD
ncbi:1419_t:CDS:1 [Ambispora leptoticha]|uniref:1419_t:CDS:1 n=1 Tax=Ambispora leptoticha TaxID=144679 RepID=A0A9N9BVP2_9GLOM|nr:1419_t:CDS:1 [Ambispora leptoticha]